MFSVDDSFDLDDDIFLQVDAASTCGKQLNDAQQTSHTKEQPNGGSSHKSWNSNIKQRQDVFGSNRTDSSASKTVTDISKSVPSSFVTESTSSYGEESALSKSHDYTVQKPSVSNNLSTGYISKKGFVSELVKTQESSYQGKMAPQEQKSACKKFNFKPLTAVKAPLTVPLTSDVPCSLPWRSAYSPQLSASCSLSNGQTVQNSASKIPVSKDVLFDVDEDSWLSNLEVSLDNSSSCNRQNVDSALKNCNQQTSTPVKGGAPLSLSHIALNLPGKEHFHGITKLNRQDPLTANCQDIPVLRNITQRNPQQIKSSDSKISGSELHLSEAASSLPDLKNVFYGNVISSSGPGGQQVFDKGVRSPASRVNSHTRKRKFPGPAGALPRASAKSDSAITPAEPQKQQPLQTKPLMQVDQNIGQADVFCSQKGEDKFSTGPWQVMKEDLEPQAKDILQEFSISSIIKKASKKLLPRSKVPVLCVLIDQMSMDGMEASVILRDPTGKINGTIHRLIVKEHTVDMQPGTVMVLRQVAVFSPPAVRSHYLNITPNNLVRIYSREDDKSAVSTKCVATFVEEDFKIHEPSADSLLNKSAGMMYPLHQPAQAARLSCGSGLVPSAAVKGNDVNLTKVAASTAGLPLYETHASRLKRSLSDAQMGQFPNTASSRLLNSSSVRPPVKACAASAGTKSACQQVPVPTINSGRYSSNWNSAARLQSAPTVTSTSVSDQADSVAGLWQDDQLDDILSVIGDEELLAEC